MGGRVPGSNAADSTEIYQEGIRFPVVRLFSRGEPNVSVFDILAANVRLPEMVTGDVQATVAACNYGEREFLKLVDQHGLPWLQRYLAALLDYAEVLTRSEIEVLPDGTYYFDDFIDDDGFSDDPIPLHLALTVEGSNITVDFTGSSPMVRGALNATESFTKASTYLALRCVFDADIPNNGGFMRPITVIAPKGTILNAQLPGACAARGLTGFRVSELVLAALGKAIPSKVMAASEGGNTFVTIGGTRANGEPFVHCDLIFGAWGGSHFRSDGDAMALVASNCTNIPIEVVEAEYPLLCEQYGFVPDSGGAGRSRGGLAIIRDFRLTEGTATLQVRSDRRTHKPWGLEGGKAGTPSWNYINPNDGTDPLPSKVTTELRKGDVFRHVTGGGGGFGDPLERDTAHVLHDVLNGKITRAYAEKEYGVVVTENGDVDKGREELRRASAGSL
jgi:N-methylhydantoinase B